MGSPTRVWSLYSEDSGEQYDGLNVSEARAIVMVISHEMRPFWYAYKAGWNSWRPLKDCGVLLTSGGMSRTKITYDAPDFDVTQFPGASEARKAAQTKTEIEMEEKEPEIPVSTPEIKPPRIEPEKEFTSTSAESLDVRFETTKTGMGSPAEQSRRVNTVATSIQGPPALNLEGVEVTPIEEEEKASRDIVAFKSENPGSSIEEEVSQVSQIVDNRRTQRYRIKLHAEVVVKDKVYQTFTRDVSLGGVAVQGCLPSWVTGYGMMILSTLDMKYRLEFTCSVVENQNGRNFRLELYPSKHSAELALWLEHGVPIRKTS